jgi:hypothetical protein
MYYLIIPICKWCNAEGYLILPYCSSKINCCSSLWLRKQLDEQSRLKERKTLQKKGLSQYDRNQFKGQDEGSARFVHLIVTQFEYLGNIISMIVETNSFLNSIPFIVYLLRVFLIV